MKSPPIRRLAAEDRRLNIIQAAIEVFSEHGFRGATTRLLAEKAGVSEAIIFRHFSTKQDLYTAILDFKGEEWAHETWLEELRAIADRNDDEGVFRTVMLRILHAHRQDPMFQRLMLHAALEGHEFSRMLHSRRWPLHALLLEYIRKRQKAGALRGLHPDLIGLALIALPAHMGLITSVFRFLPLPVEDEEVAATFCNILLDGVRGGKHAKAAPAISPFLQDLFKNVKSIPAPTASKNLKRPHVQG